MFGGRRKSSGLSVAGQSGKRRASGSLYTPKELLLRSCESRQPNVDQAYLEFSDRLGRIERANQLVIAAIGAQGDQKAVDKVLKELSKPQGQS